MPASADQPRDSAHNLLAISPAKRQALRHAGFLIGLALLAAALWMVWSQRSTVITALDAVQDHSRATLLGLLVMLVGTVLANIVLSGLLFSVLTARYGRVGLMEMQALIAASSLLNYVPLRPGLPGRIAYHHVVNHIAVTDSVKVTLQAMAMSILAAMYLGAVVALSPLMRERVALLVAALALGPVALLIGAGAWRNGRRWCIAAIIRYVELLVNAARYLAAFALIGAPITFNGALALAAISALSTMLPLLSNGLGVREWAVGLATPLLSAHQVALGMTADLLNRAAELLTHAIIGSAAAAWLLHLQRSRRSLRHPESTPVVDHHQ